MGDHGGNYTCPSCHAVVAWEGERPENCLRCSSALDTWDYTFSAWPADNGFERPVYVLFRAGLNRRITMENWTHGQFRDFREGLARDGFTLREVERFPHVLPETVT